MSRKAINALMLGTEVRANINDNFKELYAAKDTILPTSVFINAKFPPEGLVGCAGNGIANETEVIQAINTYAASVGGATIVFPDGDYLISPNVISLGTGVKWQGYGKARIITKETTIHNITVSIAVGSTGVKIKDMIFDKTGDSDLTPTPSFGCHTIHVNDANDVEIANCKFITYGVTAVLAQPHQGYGDKINVHDCTALWERRTNSIYDVSVFNLDAIDVICENNVVKATRRAGVVQWMPETAFELHMPRGYVCNNESYNCKNSILHVEWPMLYTSYDKTLLGSVQIVNNRSHKGLCGISVWGAHTLANVVTKNLIIDGNYINGHLGGRYFKPSTAIELADGVTFDASYMRDIKIQNNIIEFSSTSYTSSANQITFTATTITTTGSDFEDFCVGDYIVVSGCTVNAGNNKSAFITEVANKTLTFAAATFTAGAETSAITVKINVVDFLFGGLSSDYCGAIKGVTNNSIEGLDIVNNTIIGWPYSAVSMRALQTRGTNLHKRIKVESNTFIDCAYATPASSLWKGLFALEGCNDVVIRNNNIVKGGVLNKQPVKLLSTGDYNLTNVKFLGNDVSTLTTRDAEYESLPVFKTMITDVEEFIALGCVPLVAGSGGTGGDISCRYTNSTAISVPNNVETVVDFNTKSFDTSNIHSDITPTLFTAPESGKYQITGKVEFPGNATGIRVLKLYLNTTTAIGRSSLAVNGSGTSTTLTVTTLYELVTGDVLHLSVFQNTGAAMSLVSTPNSVPCFEIIKVSSSSQNAGDGLTEADVIQIIQDYITANSVNEV